MYVYSLLASYLKGHHGGGEAYGPPVGGLDCCLHLHVTSVCGVLDIDINHFIALTVLVKERDF